MSPSHFSSHADHTLENIEYSQKIVNLAHINISPMPLLTSPPHGSGPDYVFPFTEAVLDEKLRGVATLTLHQKEKGLLTSMSLAVDDYYLHDNPFDSKNSYTTWIDKIYIPVLEKVAKAAEIAQAEYLESGPKESEIMFYEFQSPVLSGLPVEEKKEAAQFMITKTLSAMKAHFTGRILARSVRNYDEQSALAFDKLDYTGYDEIAITITDSCQKDDSFIKTQLSRISYLMEKSGINSWSIWDHLFACYPTMAEIPISEAISRMVKLVEGMDIKPVGFNGEFNPFHAPQDEIDADSITAMNTYFDSEL